jgi:hypothetical protein
MSMRRRVCACLFVPLVATAAAAMMLGTAAAAARPASDPTGAIHVSTTKKWWGIADTNIGCPNVNNQWLSVVGRKNFSYDCWRWKAVYSGKVTSSSPFTDRKLDASLRSDKIYYFISSGSSPVEYMGEVIGEVGTLDKFQAGREWVYAGGRLVSVAYSDKKRKQEVLSVTLVSMSNAWALPIGEHGFFQRWDIP